MRYILSRKGFDDKFGENSSIILPNGSMISLPIPGEIDGHRSECRYSDVHLSHIDIDDLEKRGVHASTLKELMDILGIKATKKKQVIPQCHLDPDLRYDALPEKYRKEKWTGLFGQGSGTLTHLIKNDVAPGDLFLFYGTFCHTKVDEDDGTLRYLNKSDDEVTKERLCSDPFHVIFGYLQIGAIYTNVARWKVKKQDKEKFEPWMKFPTEFESWMRYHDHAAPKYDKKKNALFVAADHLSLPHFQALPAFGIFTFHDAQVLSCTHKSSIKKSTWDACMFYKPGVLLRRRFISWNGPNPRKFRLDRATNLFESQTQGQEFVVPEYKYFNENIRSIFEENAFLLRLGREGAR